MTSPWPRLAESALARAGAVELLILDVDGVLTDGRLYYGPDGVEIKAFHARDGSAIKRLMAAGVAVAIISGRDSAALRRRAEELGIRFVYAGVDDKAAALDRLCDDASIEPARIAHVGDDLADLALFERVGLAFAVRDAHPTLLAKADHVTQTAGGQGAVGEVCDLLLAAQGKWNLAGRLS